MTLVPPVPAALPVVPDDTAAKSSAADGVVVDSAVPDSTVADSAVADRLDPGAREAAPVPSGLPVPSPRPSDADDGQEQEQEQEQGHGLVPGLTPEPAPEPVSPTPGPRVRHVRIDPPAGPRGEPDDPSPWAPGTPPRFGVVAVPQPSRTTAERRSGTPSVRPVRLTDTTAAPVRLPGATERPAAVTPVPLPVPRPVTPADPAGPVTPAVPPSTESRTEEPQP
ncbi:hypothetical protein ACFY8C_22945 [Streptomyces flavochromogenes]|uniref:Uncharacterized protein n=1 Tax=Streptomyces flavochromogenes TaxID=68199 RepID=A0ABW6XUL4_9ACTN